MIRRLCGTDEIAAAAKLRAEIAANETTLSSDWLARSGAKVVAQESGRHLETGEIPLVVNAFSSAGVERLLAVVTDSLAATPEIYEIEVAVDDLDEMSNELLGVNFVLLDPSASQCILFTAYDFKLVAGSPAFVRSVVGEPRAARSAFLAFVEDQPDALHATAMRAAEYMSWMDAVE